MKTKKYFEGGIKIPLPNDPHHWVEVMGSDCWGPDGVTQLPTVHIWGEEDTVASLPLTGRGFFSAMKVVEKAIITTGSKEWAIDGCCPKRDRVFRKWAQRKGGRFVTVTDWFNDPQEVLIIP